MRGSELKYLTTFYRNLFACYFVLLGIDAFPEKNELALMAMSHDDDEISQWNEKYIATESTNYFHIIDDGGGGKRKDPTHFH